MHDPRATLLLALADDELILGHRHSEWTGFAPHLEADLALSSIAQDEIGHALVWYRLAGELLDADDDALGLGRRPEEYRNAILVERPNRDWAYTVARQYLYDTADSVRLEWLARSRWRPLAAATGALRSEERYHLLHARTWLDRLAHGPQQARTKLREGLDAAWAEAGGLFETLPGESELVADGVLAASHSDQGRQWRELVSAELRRHELAAPVAEGGGHGGRHGRHSEDFHPLWEEMTSLYRSHPGVRW